MKVVGRVWRGLQLERDDVTLADAPQLLADPDLLTWVDLADPDQETVTNLAATLGVNTSTVEDILDSDERVKIHRYAHQWLITAYTSRLPQAPDAPRSYSLRLAVEKASALVLPHGLVTIHTGDDFDPQAMATRWTDEPAGLALGVGVLVHAFLDTVVDNQFETIQVLDDLVDQTEDVVFSGQLNQRTFPEQIHQVRQELAQMRRIVLPMREIVASIQRHRILAAELAAESSDREPPTDGGLGLRSALAQQMFSHSEVHIDPGLEPLFDDLYDHVLRAMEWTDSLRDLVSSVFETNLALQDARLNEIMKKLAGWAAIIAVPTAVTGWFGQNIPYWGFNEVSGLVASIVLIIVLSGGLYLLLRHYDWI